MVEHVALAALGLVWVGTSVRVTWVLRRSGDYRFVGRILAESLLVIGALLLLVLAASYFLLASLRLVHGP